MTFGGICKFLEKKTKYVKNYTALIKLLFVADKQSFNSLHCRILISSHVGQGTFPAVCSAQSPLEYHIFCGGPLAF